MLNIWNIFATIYAAYALWRIGRGSAPRIVLATTLALLMTATFIMELFPIHNDVNITVPAGEDRLTTWLWRET